MSPRQWSIVPIASVMVRLFSVPFLPKPIQEIIFVKVVMILDEAVYRLLPNEIIEFINDIHSGLEEGDIELMKKRLTDAINKRVDLPFLMDLTKALSTR